MKTKPVLNQIVYSLNAGDAARNTQQVLTEHKVVKVGRKYFTTRKVGVEGEWTDNQYLLEDWTEKTDYSTNSRLYSSEQEYLDSKECGVISNYLEGFFKYGTNSKGLTLEQLRKVKKHCR